MARLPRLVVPGQAHHIIQRSIDGQALFRDEEDHLAFLKWLRDAARQFKVAIHAYVLLPGQMQLLATPADENGMARLMQWVGRQYVPYFNHKYGRAGTLWQGRYRATVLEAEPYVLLCSHYLELCPVHAGLAVAAADYRWSSYAHHAGLGHDALITDHPLYWALGNTPFQRDASYRESMLQEPTAEEIALLAEAAHKGWALGSAAFKARLEQQVKRRVSPGKRGRPPKRAEAGKEC